MEISTTKFELLEIKLISALQLKLPRSLPSCEDLHTYTVVWRDPKPKLRSGVDVTGSKTGSVTKSSCSWSMLRRLTVRALQSSSSSSTASQDPGNRLIGTSRVLLGSFGNCGRCYYEGTTGTFRVFYVRGRNGEPRGILNHGVTILDGLLPYQVINDQFIGVGSTIDYEKLFGDGARAGEKEKKGVSVSCLAA